MPKKKKQKVSVVIPIYNAETTLGEVFDSLEKQTYPVEEVFLIDNTSTDSSYDLIKKYAKTSKHKVTPIRHEEDQGLSYSYNEAIDLAKTPLLITLQSDSVIVDKDGVEKLVNEFVSDSSVVGVCAYQITPRRVWESYNFWQKVLFSRHVGKVLSGRNGRFCCFSVNALKKAGKFNRKAYRTAGEDGDLFLRLSKEGKILDVDTLAEHHHNKSPTFSFKHYLYKENQMAEAVGASLSNNLGRVSLASYFTVLLRPIMLFGLLIPKLNALFALAILAYSIYYSKEAITKEWRDIRVLLLPFINIFLLFCFVYYFSRGFVSRKQRL